MRTDLIAMSLVAGATLVCVLFLMRQQPEMAREGLPSCVPWP